ncbi:hypothetical protein BC834DRAFT_806420, partial [Gloeopeniophorella convolvens]
CERCNPRTPTICCDICHPAEIAALLAALTSPAPSMPPEKPKPRQIKVPSYEPSPADVALKKALLDWRASTVKQRWPNLDFFTPDILMHYEVLQRIVDLAHARRLDSLEVFKSQVPW